MNDDEFLSLDVIQALFPQGNAQDPFSPASFKNLLMNAEGILLKLQTAYKLRTLSLHELSADKSAIEEELEEASTRATCLRTQLEDMASRVSEQDAKVADLTAQLEREKQARTAEKEAREKSIALIQASARDSRSYNEVPDILSEDLGISNAHGKQKKWRGKNDPILYISVSSIQELQERFLELLTQISKIVSKLLNIISTPPSAQS